MHRINDLPGLLRLQQGQTEFYRMPSPELTGLLVEVTGAIPEPERMQTLDITLTAELWEGMLEVYRAHQACEQGLAGPFVHELWSSYWTMYQLVRDASADDTLG